MKKFFITYLPASLLLVFLAMTLWTCGGGGGGGGGGDGAAATLTGLSINGPSSMNENSTATYTATASWSNGTLSSITPTWGVNSQMATINASGVLTCPPMDGDQTVTITATYSHGGITKTATKDVTIVNVAATLTGLTINGPSSVNESSTATYTATASWSDGSTSSVTPIWSENSPYASISAGGVLTTLAVTSNQTVTLNASYTSGGVTKTAGMTVAIVNVAATLTGLTINGPSSVNESSTATYTATASWSDGSTSSVTPSWVVTPTTYASISANGVLTTLPVPSDQTVVVGAGYSDGGITKTATKNVTILDAGGTNVSISGNLTFESVPTTQSNGLDYSSIIKKPCRGIVVEAISTSNNTVIFSTSTDSSGNYTVSVPINTLIYLKFKAQMVKTGTPSWDFRIVDNTNNKALYTAAGASFNSGTTNITNKSYYMPCGWGGTSYTSTRAAAPYAILDIAYQFIDKVISSDPSIILPQLLINWSVNNTTVSGDKTLGHIGTSHYSLSEKQLYILGKEGNDTDEYDDHVIAHESAHYFQDRLSRSDSMAGTWGGSSKLDPRIAFGEGFGNAFSGMVTDDPDYIDTAGSLQATTAIFNDLEDNSRNESTEGWFSATSVWVILYDLYDSTNDGADTVSLGFSPIYDVLVGKQKTSDSFTTIFSFLSFLKEENPSAAPAINNLVSGENITANAVDEWDSTGTETNDGGNPKSLPVYTKLTLNAPAVPMCGTGQFGQYNRLMNRRFFYFDITSPATYSIAAVPDSDGNSVIRLYSKGNLIGEEDSGSTGASETLTLPLSAGSYVGEVFYKWHVEGVLIPREECSYVSLK